MKASPVRKSTQQKVLVGVRGATEQLWNAFHNCSVLPKPHV